MSLLRWEPHYAIGIAEVDHEHRHLIDMINSLHAQMSAQDAAGRVEAFLGELYAQVAAHFALEEKVMRDRAYDAYRPHKGDHEALLDQLRDFMDEQRTGAALDDERLARNLAHWFEGHFRQHDARFHGQLPAG